MKAKTYFITGGLGFIGARFVHYLHLHEPYLLRLIEKQPQGGIYHCAGETIQSWYGFAKDILKAHQLEVPLEEIRTPSTEIKRPRFSALSTTKRF